MFLGCINSYLMAKVYFKCYMNEDDFDTLMWAWLVATAWVAFITYLLWSS